MELVAHTPPKAAQGSPVQNSVNIATVLPHTYHDHIQEMLEYGMPLIEYLLEFTAFDKATKEILKQTYKASIMLHDMGKLDKDNQVILRQEKQGRLPIDHIDAGVAIANKMGNELLGWVIRGHHAPGLANKSSEISFNKRIWRNIDIPRDNYLLRGKRHHRQNLEIEDYTNHYQTIAITQQRLQDYKNQQILACGEYPIVACKLPNESLTTRIMLSCLVDADHSSTANYHQQIAMKQFCPASTKWQARLDKLTQYVNDLDQTPYANKSARNQLRHDLFEHCLNRPINASSLEMCSASVGLGKTTAVTAYLLRKAVAYDASRLIIIAPFTNILTQTVRTLRKSMVLSDEDPEETVVENHHKVEFSHKELRQYASSWEAPILVTTAVQFFETLASANPTRLKKLHNIVGSVIFIDESHACLPPELLAISWKWLKLLSEQWGCHIIFSSGSMVEFWQNAYLIEQKDLSYIPELLSDSLLAKANQLEQQRVIYEQITNPLDKHQLITHIVEELKNFDDLRPCSLVILNTTQSSAFIAYYLAKYLEEDTANLALKNRQVLQLSTALTPNDRVKIIDEIERRQKDSEWNDKPWFLVATSCVEAGVDLDFQFGYRERCSVSSYIQVSGRINRHGKRNNAILYDFVITPDDEINQHPAFKRSSEIFADKWAELEQRTTEVNQLVTRALQNDFLHKGVVTEAKKRQKSLIDAENSCDFQNVHDEYKIINSETYTVITNSSIINSLKHSLKLGFFVDWKDIQKHSVQLWFNKIQHFHLIPIPNAQIDNVYSWIDTYDYNDFLGIFAGVIEIDTFFEQTGGVW
ncbi:DEAD/DEAH box helicase [Psychrobacter sp. I-STPA10]|uniref:DEAD/DEAH box helicase n=1 Tax=Psychrobacter sp. I-STPA10 TaxID=2585769 RepID=UPI001E42BA50|nr:DEAD/DEAH box helicase [Psychrobacter sp. I-STPA10]